MGSNDESAPVAATTYEEKIREIAERFTKSWLVIEATEAINQSLWLAYQEHKDECVQRGVARLVVHSWNVMVEPGPTDHY